MTALAFWLRTLPSESWYNSYRQPHNGVQINHIFSALSSELSSSFRPTDFMLITFSKSGIKVLGEKNAKNYASLHFQGHFKVLLPILINFRLLIGSARIQLLVTRILVKVKLTLKIK